MKDQEFDDGECKTGPNIEIDLSFCPILHECGNTDHNLEARKVNRRLRCP